MPTRIAVETVLVRVASGDERRLADADPAAAVSYCDTVANRRVLPATMASPEFATA